MGMVKLAAGVAVGYVLGARAGREKYEQIAARARRLGGAPETQPGAAEAPPSPAGGADTATLRLPETASEVQQDAPAIRRPRQPRRRKAAPVTPTVDESSR